MHKESLEGDWRHWAMLTIPLVKSSFFVLFVKLIDFSIVIHVNLDIHV
jgi:hypothetical protein